MAINYTQYGGKQYGNIWIFQDGSALDLNGNTVAGPGTYDFNTGQPIQSTINTQPIQTTQQTISQSDNYIDNDGNVHSNGQIYTPNSPYYVAALRTSGFNSSEIGTLTMGRKDINPNQKEIPAIADSQTTQQLTQQKQFYRVGQDIFEAGTNRHIGSTEWNKDWSGRAQEVSAPQTLTAETLPNTLIQPEFSDTSRYTTYPDGSVLDKQTGEVVQGAQTGEFAGTGPQPGGTIISPTGNATLDNILKQMQDYYLKQTAAGKILNPNIPLEPSILQGFIDEATTQLAPYYQEQLAAIKEDVSKNAEYLQEQFKLTKEQDLAKFQQTLATQRESEAGAGTAFSGGRAREELATTSAYQGQFDARRLQLSNQLGQIYRGGEKLAGSRTIQDLGIAPVQFGTYTNVGAGGYAPGMTTTSYFSPTGQFGSLERERLTAIELAKKQKEQQYRTTQALELFA